MKPEPNSAAPASSARRSSPTARPLAQRLAPLSAVVRLAAGAAVCGWLAACSVLPSHIHNEIKAKIATEAQTTMRDYSKAAPAMYAAMSANVDRFKAEEDYVLGELARNAQSALVTQLPSLTWPQVTSRAGKAQEEMDTFETFVAEEGRKLRDEMKHTQEKIDSAQALVDKTAKDVKEAKENVAAWNSYIALLQQGFKNLPDPAKKADASTSLDAVKGAVEAAKSIGNQEITFADADGKQVKKKVSQILAQQAKILGGRFTGKEKGKPILPAAPGISLLILNHALELAELELHRAEAELEQAKDRLDLFADALAETRLARQLCQEVKSVSTIAPEESPFATVALVWKDAQKNFADFSAPDAANPAPPPNPPNPPNPPKPTPQQMAGSMIAHENSVAGSATALRKLAVAESMAARNRAVFPVKMLRLRHQQSIALSEFADATHRALIQAQLDGLTAYHQGGFTKEDAATIVRLAQAVAVFSIANNQ
jgi:hypothetical protein